MTHAPIPPTGRVHWLGTGMSTGSGLGLVRDTATALTLWGRTREKADACLARIGRPGGAQTRAYDPEALSAALRPGDLVVSMLPPTAHAAVLRRCLTGGAHFASSSYVSPEVAALSAEAAGAGLVVLTEAGLDPGIDHLLAHELVRDARDALGDRPGVKVRFTSYCGSFPAEPNEFRYRFSWAPRGVLTALRSPAQHLEHGRVERTDRPYRSVREVTLAGERFEVYPNRDSLPFITEYRFPDRWTVDTFIRGTVRQEGWTTAWEQVFTAIEQGSEEEITRLATELAARYPATAEDHDRVVMFVTLDATAADGSRWAGEYTMDVTGDATESATPRLVSVALAGGIDALLAGRFAPGLHRAATGAEDVRRWLGFLAGHGLHVFRTDPIGSSDG